MGTYTVIAISDLIDDDDGNVTLKIIGYGIIGPDGFLLPTVFSDFLAADGECKRLNEEHKAEKAQTAENQQSGPRR